MEILLLGPATHQIGGTLGGKVTFGQRIDPPGRPLNKTRRPLLHGRWGRRERGGRRWRWCAGRRRRERWRWGQGRCRRRRRGIWQGSRGEGRERLGQTLRFQGLAGLIKGPLAALIAGVIGQQQHQEESDQNIEWKKRASLRLHKFIVSEEQAPRNRLRLTPDAHGQPRGAAHTARCCSIFNKDGNLTGFVVITRLIDDD